MGGRGFERRVEARVAADEPTARAQLWTRVRAFAGRTPVSRCGWKIWADPRHRPVLCRAGAVSANVATLVPRRRRCANRACVVRRALGASRARVMAREIVTEGSRAAGGSVRCRARAGGVVGPDRALCGARARVRNGDSLLPVVGWECSPGASHPSAYALLLTLVAASTDRPAALGGPAGGLVAGGEGSGEWVPAGR